jgi:hypothetical protein
MRFKRLNQRQALLGLSFVCLALIQSQSAIAISTAKDYEQFRGGVDYPDCVAVQKKGGITGSVGQARFDGKEAKYLVLAINSGCRYYGVRHTIVFQ